MSHGPEHTTVPVNELPAGGLGIPTRGLILTLVAILLAIMQGSFVVKASPWGRVWPSSASTTVELPPMNLKP